MSVFFKAKGYWQKLNLFDRAVFDYKAGDDRFKHLAVDNKAAGAVFTSGCPAVRGCVVGTKVINIEEVCRLALYAVILDEEVAQAVKNRLAVINFYTAQDVRAVA